MKHIVPPHRRWAKMRNGDEIKYDRAEEHDNIMLLFRSPVGLVYSTTKDNIITLDMKDKHDSNATHAA